MTSHSVPYSDYFQKKLGKGITAHCSQDPRGKTSPDTFKHIEDIILGKINQAGKKKQIPYELTDI